MAEKYNFEPVPEGVARTAEEIAERLKAEILGGQLKDETELPPIRDLCQIFGQVSPTTIRPTGREAAS